LPNEKRGEQMAKKYRIVEHKDPISVCLSDGVNDIRELYDEMLSWQEQMDSADMRHLPKYDEVTAAVEVLERVEELDSAIGEIENLIDAGTIGNEDVTYHAAVPYGKRAQPRWMRHSTAINQLQAVVYFLRDSDKGNSEDGVLDAVDELASQIGEFESVDFPGMY